MSNEDSALSKYIALKPSDFSVLQKLELRQSVPPDLSQPELNLEIELRKEDEKDSGYLQLSFLGVRNLKLHQPSWSLFQLSPLEISSIRDRQWEYLNYEVKESEESTLSFLCRDFDIEVRRS